MKKILSIAVAAMAGVVLADTSTPIGVTKITTTKKNTVVAVPYTALATGSAIPVGDLVKPYNLDAGTFLYTYVGGQYAVYALKNDKSGWEAATGANVGDGLPAAAEPPTTLAKGSAIWIVLPAVPDPSKDIYIYGKYETSFTQSVSAGANLLANPLQTAATISITPVKGDIIQIPNDDGVTTQYKWTWKKGQTEANAAWYSNNVAADLPVIPAGTGFWYIRKSGSANVSWTAQ